MKTKTKTKTGFITIIRSLTCTVLAAAMLFTGTSDVSAAKKSTWKTVTLNSSCTAFSNTKMVLSEDGETLTCYYSAIEEGGSKRTSVDLKSALPADLLKKFEDGEVYLYAEDEGDDWMYAEEEAIMTYKEELEKNVECNNVKVTRELDGYYTVTWDTLWSNTEGTGKVEINKIDDDESYYLADKNGKKIVNIVFEYKKAVEGVTYIKYQTKTTAKLSKNGKTVTITYSDCEADGSPIGSINIKKALPEEVLSKFEDEEVYLYGYEGYAVTSENFYEAWDSSGNWNPGPASSAAAKKNADAMVKKLKANGNINVKITHYDGSGKKVSHEEYDDGRYEVSWHQLLSNKKGSGKISQKHYKTCGKSSCSSFEDYYFDGFGYSKLYLADKNGKKIINIKFQEYETPKTEVTCSLDGLEKADKYGCLYIILKSGESLSEKLSFTGTSMTSSDYSKVVYDSNLLTVKKDGTVTAKKGKYGITSLSTGDNGGGYVVCVTDGSSKMFKTFSEWRYIHSGYGCILTIGKNGKYTTKETGPY